MSSPEIYRVNSPSQTQVASNIGTSKNYGSQSAQRHPLRTISVSDLLESPEDVPLKRLRRRSMSPAADVSNGGYRSTPSPSPTKKPSNIFDEMLRAQANKEKAEKKKLEKSEFVEAEAEESDDDDQFGFGKYRKNDEGEEQDGEEQDKTLEGLVDDAEMDDATMAADLVLEKVKYVTLTSTYATMLIIIIGSTKKKMTRQWRKYTAMPSKENSESSDGEWSASKIVATRRRMRPIDTEEDRWPKDERSMATT